MLNDDFSGDGPEKCTFQYNKHETDISLDFQAKEVKFTYRPSSDTTVDKNKFKVSKLSIYYWIEDAGNQSPKQTYSVGNNKYSVIFNYSEGNNADLKSIFENWSESLLPGDPS